MYKTDKKDEARYKMQWTGGRYKREKYIYCTRVIANKRVYNRIVVRREVTNRLMYSWIISGPLHDPPMY